MVLMHAACCIYRNRGVSWWVSGVLLFMICEFGLGTKKHHTHPSKIKSTKMVPGGQKYAASQTQGAASMGVGGAGLASSPLCLLSLPCLVSLPSPALLFANLRATPPLPVTVAGRPCS